MKLAYVTTYDARESRAWSGLGNFMWRALAASGVEVELVGPLPQPATPDLLLKRALNRYGRGKQYLWDRSPRSASRLARRVRESLREVPHDVVLSPDTVPVAFLDHDRPVATWTDATFASMLGFYPGFDEETIARESIVDGLRLEGEAIERCRLSMYGSDWAAASAIHDFGADERRVEVVPFGANVAREPTSAEVASAIAARSRDSCNLLFLGSDWVRKGGPLATDVVAMLNEGGVHARLTVIGCDPAVAERSRPFVNIVGFLDKTGVDAGRFEGIVAAAHFLILPTHAECFGLPICEASAYGVPSLVANVGGVSTPLRDGANGALFAADAAAADYASYIERVWTSRTDYEELAQQTRREYERRLNWRTAAGRVKSLLAGL